MNTNVDILGGYVAEADFARAANISQRTVARYRNQPNGLPHLVWGGRILIPLEEARAWLAGQVRRPNQRRKAA